MPSPKHRRSTLPRRALAMAATPLLPGCAWLLSPPPLPPPPVPGGLCAIDIHCHVFNATDLPVPGFLHHVLLSHLTQIPLSGPAFAALSKLVGICLSVDVQRADAELRDIQSGARVAGVDEDIDSLMRARLRLGLTRLLQAQAPPGGPALLSLRLDQAAVRAGRPPADAAAVRQLMAELAARAATPGRRQGRLRIARSAPPSDLVERAIEGVMAIEDEVKGVLRLVTLLTRPRRELVRRLAALPAAAVAGEIRLFTPALIDFTLWLDQSPFDHADINPMTDQVAVMEAIAALPDQAYGVHPYAAFCPWRQMRGGPSPSPLAIVRDAVENRGFIGVKVYPVLGFLPYGNAGLTDAEAAELPRQLLMEPDWRRRLDRALADLYDWCAEMDVPILTHTSHSQFPTTSAGLRGAPGHWLKVLTDPDHPTWRALRINLGHIGGLQSLDPPPRDPWPDQAVRLMAAFPNVFADLGDYDAIIPGASSAQNGRILANLASALAANPMARNRLMYGTDWLFLSRAKGAEGYYPAMRDGIGTPLNLDANQRLGFIGGNAARFLGLARQGGRAPLARQRLEAFYAARGLNPARLALWDL